MKSEAELDQIIARLPREISPERDLWPSLEPRLAERRAARRHLSAANRAWALAATLVLVVALGWRVMLVPETQSPQLADNSEDAAGLPVVSEPEAVTTNLADPLPAEYLIAEQYEQVKAQHLGRISPSNQTFGNWEYQLSVWDGAIGQVRDALSYHPDDPRLLAQMQGLYEQQMNFLQLVSAVDSNEFDDYLPGEQL